MSGRNAGSGWIAAAIRRLFSRRFSSAQRLTHTAGGLPSTSPAVGSRGDIETLALRRRRYLAAGVDEAISPTDDMFNPERTAHYFHCGRDAIRLVELALLAGRVPRVRRVLDMPSGSGRVTRHLVRYFPEAQVVACDLYAHHIEFCARQFGAIAVPSSDDLAGLRFPEPFDLIWCGSLLTHLPVDQFIHTLELFARSLADRGVAIVTTHGRWSIFRQQETPYPYDSEESFARAATTLATGFGFTESASSEAYPANARYGTSWSLASYVVGQLERMPDVRILGCIERGWDNHQDVIMFQKEPIYARPWLYEETAPVGPRATP